MIFTSPICLVFACAVATATVAIVWIRRPALHWVSLKLGLLGMICISLSAGGISWRHSGKPRIAVMVDCSPSTRGASFHNGADLRARLHELLGDRDFKFYTFADKTLPAAIAEHLDEIPADQTVFTPPPADAVILFSDGRFDPPTAAPPVFAVIDPSLDHPIDAAIQTLERRGDSVIAQVNNAGPSRQMIWDDSHHSPLAVPNGSIFATTRPVAITQPIAARLTAGDEWPENDALSLSADPPIASERWWIGQNPPAGWRAIPQTDLPLDPAEWLAPAIVVLNNLPADALSPPQQDRLQQYVRDLGGALVILGGDHAFAAGGYAGSELESLSPLSSSPPTPARHWILLVDSSGSMAAPTGQQSRFAVAADAVIAAARSLPANDLLSIGSFARELHWWSAGKTVKETLLLPLPPSDVAPAGPTNLEATLRDIAESLPPSLPTDALVLTDAETSFQNPDAIIALLKQHQIRLHLLAIGESKTAGVLSQIVNATGGKELQTGDPSAWASTVRSMLRAAQPDQLIHSALTVTFAGDLASLPGRTIPLADQTWLKNSAVNLAEARDASPSIPLAARWHVGSGDVVAAAFSLTQNEIGSMTNLIARRPRDPRFSVQWRSGSTLHIRIDAQDHGDQLNGATLSIQIGQDVSRPILQTAPGRYEIDLPSSRSPQIVTIRHDSQLLDLFAIAGRYPREFDDVGNDLPALADLAHRTGGAVIEPSQHQPIEFHEPQIITSFASLMAAIGAGLIALSLLWWRLVPQT